MLRGQRGRELLAHMPQDRVLTESDGPFAQVNARPALPTDIGAALEHLSEVWSVSRAEAETRVTDNFRRLVSLAEQRL
jgi:TatD DNase family protein